MPDAGIDAAMLARILQICGYHGGRGVRLGAQGKKILTGLVDCQGVGVLIFQKW